MTSASILLSACLAAAGVSFDAEKHSVTVEARSNGLQCADILEFLLVGPASGNEYESMFTTVATPAEIAEAFEKAGIPRGVPVDPRAASFWPVGRFLEMEPSFAELVRDTSTLSLPPPVYTGGARDAGGAPVSETNGQCAVFALYGFGPSMILLDDCLDQGASYGRFHPAEAIAQGETRRVTFTWKGGEDWRPYDLRFEPGRLQEALAKLREASAACALSVRCTFSPELTVREAAACAAAVEVLDSRRVKVNGTGEGDFFYRAFLPDPVWRDRRKRLAQPPEVRFTAEGKVRVTEILEDWNVEGLDPRLTERETVFDDDGKASAALAALAERTGAVLVFAPADLTLARLRALKAGVKSGRINWFVFADMISQ